MNEELPAFSVVILNLPNLLNKTKTWVSRMILLEFGVKKREKEEGNLGYVKIIRVGG